jgi:hypothetical protein
VTNFPEARFALRNLFSFVHTACGDASALAKHNDVEIITPDFACGLPSSRDLHTRKLRQHIRQQHLLNFARPLKFLLLLLQGDRSFLDRLLEKFVSFLQFLMVLVHHEPNCTGDDHYND